MRSMQFFRILGFAALLLMAAGQALHASEILYAADEAGECHHEHSDTSPKECPAEHSCCHAHGSGMTLAVEAASLPEIPCRDFRFSQADSVAPDGCPREIDHPPQLS